ncbi:MAG: hypothetical protein GXY82_04655 [Methanospirillum sp.]|nr:hypothetical protein [Methanospirillum sp.]
MNRKLMLISISTVAIVGIGVGILLPALQSESLTGSIVPITTMPSMMFTLLPTPTPTPVPPVSIMVTGSYSPYRTWNNDIKAYDWYWNLHSVNTYDATHLPPGVVLQRVSWTITGTLGIGGTRTCVNRYIQRFEGLPELDLAPQELALTGSATIDDGYSVGCYGPDLCPPDDWCAGPPFTATCTITTKDGMTYTRSAELVLST